MRRSHVLVADTIEPLQATAEKVGRVTDRFSRKG